jgi:DNA polymerase-1
MAAFDGTSDFYSVIGQEVYGKFDCTPQKEGVNSFGAKYKHLRQNAKTIALARAYGATPSQLASTVGKSVEDTAQDLLQLDEAFPGIRTMMLEAHELAKSQGYVTNLYGRRRRLPDALKIQRMYGKIDHWDLPYEARRILNMACNFRIQSTGASLINRAAVKFYSDCKELDLDVKIVSQVHDQLVVECPEANAEQVCLLLQNAMESTNILPGVALEAVPWIAKSLAK